MTTMYQCDVCGRIRTEETAKMENWQTVVTEPMDKDRLYIPSVSHYCGRCYIFYCSASKYIEDEYNKIKGTRYDKYANEDTQ